MNIFTWEGDTLIGAARLTVPKSQRNAACPSPLRELKGVAEKKGNIHTSEDVPGEFKLEFPVIADRKTG